MDRPWLNDKNEYPGEEVLAKYLGKTKRLWDEFAGSLSSRPAPLALEWNYYNDGKAWLGKLTHKKKTVCWISVWDQYFKMGFYFTAKNDGGVKDLAIDPDLKKAYLANKTAGKLKALSIEVKTPKALQHAFEVIKYKISVLK